VKKSADLIRIRSIGVDKKALGDECLIDEARND
jgi:hypothetical protein